MGDVIVKTSKIHGKGVFANKNFKKGEVVIKYNLKQLTKKEFGSLSDKEKHYTTLQEDKYWLFPSPERYVNHSSNSNTVQDIKNACDVAIRDIQKGEQITTDASKDDI